MKKRFLSMACAIMSLLMLVLGAIPVGAEEIASPYGSIDGTCITDIQMESRTELLGGVDYFKAVVTSHIQGLENRAAIPYRTFVGVGNENTKMFVYSIGSEDGLDFVRATTKAIVEQFEAENPQWNAVVAVNGDFFDIESKQTSSMGEPEFPMIQNGDSYKTNVLSGATGRGIVGTTADGEMIYYTVGGIYKNNGYGTDFTLDNIYSLQIYGEHRTNVVAEYPAHAEARVQKNRISFLTPDSKARDLTGATVYEVKCDVYRRAHVGINGAEMSTTGYFSEGEIVNIRKGKANELPQKGYIYIATKNPEVFDLLQKGTYLKCQRELTGAWENVDNAIGFKQLLLANGTQLLKNAYGTYNQSGNYEETIKWTEDIYDYPFCWKDRTAIGFKEDGTPVLFVIKKSLHDGDYKNIGASYYEISAQMKALGCVDGFLLDGGGSSTFVIRNEDGTFSNAHVGEGSGRAVANAVILAVRDESVPDPILDEEIEVILPEPEKETEKKTEKKTEAPTEPETEVVSDSDTEPQATEGSSGCGAYAVIPAALVTTIGAAFISVKRKRRK